MSRYLGKQKSSHSVRSFLQGKAKGEKIAMITCYDAAFGHLIEQTDIDMVLVGDSLGNVVLGFEDTLKVSMSDMIHHCAAVSRVVRKPLICADMPFMSYQISPEQALQNAGRLIQEGGAHAVKLEGGQSIIPQVKAIIAAGIPVMGHLGLQPQSVHLLGGYRLQGQSPAEKKIIIADALALEEAGVFAIVLEMIPPDLALELSQMLKIPTIGIGAGPHCDGQVLVLHDLLGFEEETPKFVKKYAQLGHIIKTAVSQYASDVKHGTFPS